MNSVFNRLILFLGLTAFILTSVSPQKAILPLLSAIALSGFLEYFNSAKLNMSVFVGYTVLCAIYPQFIYFLPLAFYDIILTKHQLFALLSLIPILTNISGFSINQALVMFLFSIIELILKFRSLKTSELHSKFIKQRDDLTEISIRLEQNIKELTDRQDTEVNLATLNERNRIAREIHDSVGHLLSSSILQIGAVMAVTKEETTKSNLETVKKTLDQGMNSIRESVHNLHDNSIDLYSQLNQLIKDFTFCTASLNYEINSVLNAKVKYAVIAIVKEALANVMKHSNATNVIVSLYEHPSLYQLIILDNGTDFKKNQGNGMGLESINQRVYSLNGIINFSNTNGFRIFISFPKTNEEKV